MRSDFDQAPAPEGTRQRIVKTSRQLNPKTPKPLAAGATLGGLRRETTRQHTRRSTAKRDAPQTAIGRSTAKREAPSTANPKQQKGQLRRPEELSKRQDNSTRRRPSPLPRRNSGGAWAGNYTSTHKAEYRQKGNAADGDRAEYRQKGSAEYGEPETAKRSTETTQRIVKETNQEGTTQRIVKQQQPESPTATARITNSNNSKNQKQLPKPQRDETKRPEPGQNPISPISQIGPDFT